MIETDRLILARARDYAMRKLKIAPESMCSFIRRSNKASQQVSEKIGMQKVKEYRAQDIDYYLYAFTGNSWG